jgi:hypothetical protein
VPHHLLRQDHDPAVARRGGDRTGDHHVWACRELRAHWARHLLRLAKRLRV